MMRTLMVSIVVLLILLIAGGVGLYAFADQRSLEFVQRNNERAFLDFESISKIESTESTVANIEFALGFLDELKAIVSDENFESIQQSLQSQAFTYLKDYLLDFEKDEYIAKDTQEAEPLDNRSPTLIQLISPYMDGLFQQGRVVLDNESQNEWVFKLIDVEVLASISEMLSEPIVEEITGNQSLAAEAFIDPQIREQGVFDIFISINKSNFVISQVQAVATSSIKIKYKVNPIGSLGILVGDIDELRLNSTLTLEGIKITQVLNSVQFYEGKEIPTNPIMLFLKAELNI